MEAPPVIPLDWTRKHKCKRCGLWKECYATVDGLRCKPCRPKGWTPPDALAWLTTFRYLVRPW